MKNTKYIIFLFVAFPLFFYGCRTTKKTEQRDSVKIKTNEIFEYVLNNEPKFNTMNISSLNIKINGGGQSFSTKGFLRIVRDSAIMISVQPIAGIEVARILITPDSITVVDRFNSRYYTGNVENLNTLFKFDVDFQSFQSMLSNQLFLSGINKEKLTEKMFAVSAYPDGYQLNSNQESCPFFFNFIANKYLQIEKTTVTDKVKPHYLNCEYSDFVKNGDFDFPNKIKLTAFDGRMPYVIEFNINKIEFDKPVNVNISIPAKYEKISIENLKSFSL